MNLNTVAKQVCELEGGKVNLSIAQVKEVIGCLFFLFTHKYTEQQVIDALDRYYDRYYGPKG